MKTILYYFTGTGNSLKVAEDLAKELEDAELVPVVRLLDRDSVSVSADRIGIIFPVYMWGLPIIIKDFIKKLDVDRATYIFGVATYGGFPAATLKQLNNLLKEKGLKLSSGFGLHLPGNYTPLYEAIAEEKQRKLFSEVKRKIKQIAKFIGEGRRGKIESNFFLINMIFSGLIYTVSAPKIPRMDAGFWLNEKCNSCGVCSRVCPVNNIEMQEGKPKWLHHCQQCLACLHWCPQEAIELGKKTPGRKRYHHPEIKAADIMGQKDNQK